MASQINYSIPNYLWHPKLIMASQIIYGIPVFSYEKYMAKYEKENIEWIPRILKLNEKKIILIIYDECIFYSNNKCEQIEKLSLRKKENRHSIMVSKFLM